MLPRLANQVDAIAVDSAFQTIPKGVDLGQQPGIDPMRPCRLGNDRLQFTLQGTMISRRLLLKSFYDLIVKVSDQNLRHISIPEK
jgi:hypothetical protein